MGLNSNLNQSQRFFCLVNHPTGDDAGANTEFLTADPNESGPARNCPKCGNSVGPLQWLAPHNVELECWGRAYSDLSFGYGAGYGFIVSERFKILYEFHGFTGLSAFALVSVVRVKRRWRIKGEVPNYFRVDVARSRAAIDPIASGFVWDRPHDCPECRIATTLKRFKRLVLEPGTWSGEDIFMPRGISVYMVTERFKRFCEDNEITNAVFVPAEEYWEDTNPSQDMERAAEILAAKPGGDILEKIGPAGEILRYQLSTNFMLMTDANGTVQHFFRPVDRVEFWENQPGTPTFGSMAPPKKRRK